MSTLRRLTADDLRVLKISIFEPFSDFLQGDLDEKHFEVSLLDVVRFAGHACPSMVGAFLITQKAISELFPESGVCIRGDVMIDVPRNATQGPTGPMANVFSYITGAWAETGFGGMGDRFCRRNLLRFNSPMAPEGGYRFTRLSTGVSIDVFCDFSKAQFEGTPDAPFQLQWRERIKAALDCTDRIVWSRPSPST